MASLMLLTLEPLRGVSLGRAAGWRHGADRGFPQWPLDGGGLAHQERRQSGPCKQGERKGMTLRGGSLPLLFPRPPSMHKKLSPCTILDIFLFFCRLPCLEVEMEERGGGGGGGGSCFFFIVPPLQSSSSTRNPPPLSGSPAARLYMYMSLVPYI